MQSRGLSKMYIHKIDIQWNLSKADTIGTMKWCPLYGSVRFKEITFVRYAVLVLTEFDLKNTKMGQNLCPLYKECPLYGVSVLDRFHCIKISVSYIQDNICH